MLTYTLETRLIIYDVLGRRVRVLVDDVKQAGIHRVQWDAKNNNGRPIAAGLYFAKLQAGDFRSTIKLMLIR
ncbi:T9SS type A sorting domain-containing protein [candidate division KSB1 bacterium]|nr:T9SS type A sorting domain-containing protein [candidate division KSB1 bacterium]